MNLTFSLHISYLTVCVLFLCYLFKVTPLPSICPVFFPSAYHLSSHQNNLLKSQGEHDPLSRFRATTAIWQTVNDYTWQRGLEGVSKPDCSWWVELYVSVSVGYPSMGTSFQCFTQSFLMTATITIPVNKKMCGTAKWSDLSDIQTKCAN